MILVSFSIYFVWFLIGLFFGFGYGTHEGEMKTHEQNEYLINVHNLEHHNQKEYILSFVLLNNIKVIFILAGGAFTLGLLTLVGLCFNGALFGSIIGASINSGVSIYELFLLTFPHGMFELPALWLAGAAGLKGPQVFIRYLRGGQFVTKQDIKEFLILSLTSIILIIIAGIIEATITYQIFLDLSNSTKY